jgi:hypothetical protein
MEFKFHYVKDLEFTGFLANAQGKEFHPNAPQGIVKIYKNHDFDEFNLFKEYYWFKFFKSDEFSAFVKSLVRTEVTTYHPN